MSPGLGIPLKLLYDAVGHTVTMELKIGEIYRGDMVEVDDNWNCQLEKVTFTAKDGKVKPLEHVFVRGSHIRFFIIPDVLNNAPMFKRFNEKIKGRRNLLNFGRGRMVIGKGSQGGVGRGAAGARGDAGPSGKLAPTTQQASMHRR